MRLNVFLLCLSLLCWRTTAQARTYLVSAPRYLRLDALETVVVQVFGYTEEVMVEVFLKSSMAPGHVQYAREVVTLNAQNHYLSEAKVRIFPDQLSKETSHVILHVYSREIDKHQRIDVDRRNGFLFIQTDKPLYTPQQHVKVRAFSLNEELRPANRNVSLTFKDPDDETVDIREMIDVNNGIPSMKNPFKIPAKPKLGVWSITATYSEDFTTTAGTVFEIKEYVLPSVSILLTPEVNYISYGNFQHFRFEITARYVHGAPVADAEVFVRYGYVSGKTTVIIPGTVRVRLSSSGRQDVTVNMETVLSSHNGPKNLNSLVGKYLYIAVLLIEDTGGISQEAELATVKFVKSPYTLSLVATPPFIKPGLPYKIRVSVKDHLGQPVSKVPVRLTDSIWRRDSQHQETMSCPGPDTIQTNQDGLALFICNPQKDARTAVIQFETSDSDLPLASQATLSLEAVAYSSPNQRYLYIDPPFNSGLGVGHPVSIRVYSATPTYLSINSFSYLVISKGKIVAHGSQAFVGSHDGEQRVHFTVTPAMVPSIRLLVYYVLYGEGRAELVADSIWMDVNAKCVSGLKTQLTYRQQSYKPEAELRLDVETNQDGLVALSAVDSSVYSLRVNHHDPLTRVLRHIEQSDQGCGGGGGKDNADVFRLAGLTFITNANAHPAQTNDACTAALRPRRALTEEEKIKKAESYGPLKMCCEKGMSYSPSSVSCAQNALQIFRGFPRCRQVYRICCEFHQRHLDEERGLILARLEMGPNFDQAPTLVRSYFPESWLWEVQRARAGLTSFTRTLPHSLTSWEFRAIGMFSDGICVAEPVSVSVSLPVSVNVPLPYQLVRGDQLELSGSVYNQQADSIEYCVTLTAGPAVCLLNSQPSRQPGLRSTVCQWSQLAAESVGKLAFTLMALEPGEHTLTFTLKTRDRDRDILQKKLRVVPEGIRAEVVSGGTLDPQGLYGSEKRVVELKNRPPPNLVPNTPVERILTINGEVLGEVLSVVENPEGLRQLINLPVGSAEAELAGLLPLVYVYQYLETSGRWDIMGSDVQKNSKKLQTRIKEGLVGLSSFRGSDSTYSVWRNKEPSTWLTAQVVKTLSQLSLSKADVPVDHLSLAQSVTWLIRETQSPDGSFRELSSFRPNKVMAGGGNAMDQSVYLTSFVLIGLLRAMKIDDRNLQLKSFTDSVQLGAAYLSQHAPGVQSVYVRAVACYALTLHDPDSRNATLLYTSLEQQARTRGNPVLRYWQEPNVAADWLRPDQSSGLTVETTAYVLLTALEKGGIYNILYTKPILTWLTQDQHYGEGFHSTQDTVLTLEAIAEYSKVAPRAVLDLDINVRYARKGELARVELRQTRPVSTPIPVSEDDDIRVVTGGTGVSHVKLKSVYYQTTASSQNCQFNTTIEVLGPDPSNIPSKSSPHLVACAKYNPPPNEMVTESSLTVMKIQLPSGVEAYIDDLRQFRDGQEAVISHYELQGDTVVIQIESVPSDIFLCVGFRIRAEFQVGVASDSVFRIYEPMDRGSMCTKQYSYKEQKLQRLCVAEQCQCMTALCSTFRTDVDLSLTVDRRVQETCQSNIKYAYKLKIVSSSSEGDFVVYKASVMEVLKNHDKDFEGVVGGVEVELVKKVTCSSVDLQNNSQYLLLGATGLEITLTRSFKYRFPLDSEAVVELWPSACGGPPCSDYISQLEEYAFDLNVLGCS